METHADGAGVERMRIVGGDLALDFVNTRAGPPSGPPDDDVLVGYDDLVAWSLHRGTISAAEAAALREQAGRDLASAGKAHARALDLRDELDRVFRAVAGGTAPPARSVDEIRRTGAEALARGALVEERGRFAWSWAADRSLDRPIDPVVHAALELLATGPLERLKACGGCSFLFVDTSKNRSRRWCSMEDCGTNEKMRRFVARRADRRRLA